jgi:hypothetical protein
MRKWWRTSEGYCTLCALVTVVVFIYMAFSIEPRLSRTAIVPDRAHNDQRNNTGDTKRDAKNYQGNNGKSFWQALISPSDPLVFLNLCLVAVTGLLAASTVGLWVVTWQSGRRQSRDMQQAIRVSRLTSLTGARQARAMVAFANIRPPTDMSNLCGPRCTIFSEPTFISFKCCRSTCQM